MQESLEIKAKLEMVATPTGFEPVTLSLEG
jgi:hypothetical protein